LAHGVPIFEYFASNPDDAAVFQEAMTAFSGYEAHAVADAYDFGAINSVVGVGGGHGLLLATILAANPHLSGVLFDLPFMIEGARGLLAEHGVGERCGIEYGDSIPGGDMHLLKNIVHDFEDDAAVSILTNCRRAATPGGRLLVAQEALPTGNEPIYGKLLDSEMIVIGGRERPEADFRKLFDRAGYRLTRILPTRTGLHVIEGITV
jgi:hypothetical protein